MASSRSRRRCSSARRRASCTPIWRTCELRSSRSRGMPCFCESGAIPLGGAPSAQRADLFEMADVDELDQLEAALAGPFESRDLAIRDALGEPQVVDSAAHGVDQDGLA